MSLKHFSLLLSLALLVLTSFSEALGQSAQEKQAARESVLREEAEARRNEQARQRLENIRRQARPPVRRTWVIKEKYKLTSRDKKLLAPTPEDRSTYADFLRQPETGLFRLLPYQVGDARTVSAADIEKPRVLISGAGSLYSFSKRRYGADEWSEVLLRDGLLNAGITDESIGLLIALGDVPIESITPSSPGVAELSAFVPATDHTLAVKLHLQSKAALEIGGFLYRSSLPALISTTYALRSISYRRSDVIIVFRVLHEAPDGGITILWKKVNTYAARS